MKKLTMVASFVAIALSAQANAGQFTGVDMSMGAQLARAGLSTPVWSLPKPKFFDVYQRTPDPIPVKTTQPAQTKQLGKVMAPAMPPETIKKLTPTIQPQYLPKDRYFLTNKATGKTIVTSPITPKAYENVKTAKNATYTIGDVAQGVATARKVKVKAPTAKPYAVPAKADINRTPKQVMPSLDQAKVAQANAVPKPAYTQINALPNPKFTGTGKAPAITKTYTTVSAHTPTPAQAPAKMAVPPQQITVKPNPKQVINGTSKGQAIPPVLTVKKPNGYFGFTSHSTTLDPITTIPKLGQSASPAQPVTPAKAPVLAPSKAPVLAPALQGTATPVSAPLVEPKPMSPGLAPGLVPQKKDIAQTPTMAPVSVHAPKKIAQAPLAQAPAKGVTAPKLVTQVPAPVVPAKAIVAPKVATQVPAPLAPAKDVTAPQTVAQVPPAQVDPVVSAPTATTQSQPAKPSALAIANANTTAQNAQRTVINRHDIANNEARINDNSQAIAQNSNDIQDLRKAFEHQAEVMDGAMAQGIATSSLVMPYNVGKISTTVALGHSGSANAIAGGVGMRFTENFTARANMAYDDGSENVSIGAGVGYEF